MSELTKENIKPFIGAYTIGSSGPAWLKQAREKAWASAARIGLPNAKAEAWKYTKLKGLEKKEYTRAKPKSASFQNIKDVVNSWPALVFVNGEFQQKLSRLPKSGAVEIKALSELNESPSPLELFNNDKNMDVFESISMAISQNGVLVDIAPDSALKEPLQIVHIYDANNEVASSNVVVSVGRGSKLQLVELHLGLGEQHVLACPSTRVSVGQNARIEIAQVVRQNLVSDHVGSMRVDLGKDAYAHLFNFSTAGRVTRNNAVAVLSGEGAHAEVNGLYLTKGNEHIDNHTEIRHESGQNSSHQLYKGVLQDNSRAVFNGKIFIAQDAQKVDSSQFNHNLLLSDGAEVDTKPELQIYADDVKAAHGASVGQISKDELFYLQSRAIDRPTAEKMLMHGFIDHVTFKIESADLRNMIQKIVGGEFGL